MNWIRILAVLAALVIHAGVGGGLVYLGGAKPETNALQSGSGRDDLSSATEVTLATEESLGLDSASVERQDASAGAPPQPEPKPEEPKKEDAVEATPPPPEAAPPQAPVQEKPPEKEVEKQETASPAAPAAPQEEQHAQTRVLEARRNRALSRYGAEISLALKKHARWSKNRKSGHLWAELTLAPSGALISYRIVESSGSSDLDETAIESIKRAAPFPHAPKELGDSPHTMRVPFEYSVKE